MAVQIETVGLEEVYLDPANVRTHNERNLDAIANSLRRFGQQKPIVCAMDGMIVAGNGTWEAARKLGWANIRIVRTALQGVERAAFAIADNRTAELADWDYTALVEQMQTFENSLQLETGFSPEDLANLMIDVEYVPDPENDGLMPSQTFDRIVVLITKGKTAVYEAVLKDVREIAERHGVKCVI